MTAYRLVNVKALLTMCLYKQFQQQEIGLMSIYVSATTAVPTPGATSNVYIHTYVGIYLSHVPATCTFDVGGEHSILTHLYYNA